MPLPLPRGAGDRRRCRAALENRVSGCPICCSAPLPSGEGRIQRGECGVAPLLNIYSRGVGGSGVHAECRVPPRRPRKVHAGRSSLSWRPTPLMDAGGLICPPAFPLVSGGRLAATMNRCNEPRCCFLLFSSAGRKKVICCHHKDLMTVAWISAQPSPGCRLSTDGLMDFFPIPLFILRRRVGSVADCNFIP